MQMPLQHGAFKQFQLWPHLKQDTWNLKSPPQPTQGKCAVVSTSLIPKLPNLTHPLPDTDPRITAHDVSLSFHLPNHFSSWSAVITDNSVIKSVCQSKQLFNLCSAPQLLHTSSQSFNDINTHTQPFNGLWSGTTRVGRYQKKHSPTHTHPDHRTSFIILIHLQRSMASTLFILRA